MSTDRTDPAGSADRAGTDRHGTGRHGTGRRSTGRRSTGRRVRRRARAFAGAFTVVVAVLAAVALGGAALTTAQGPRVTSMQFDPEAAVTASGSRVIFTTSQSLDEIDPSQVTISPAADFTVDTSGRSVGLRFALPLWDDTEYHVRIENVTGLGGGPAVTIERTLSTPPAQAYILDRGGDGDTVFRTDLAGDAAVPVYTAEHIEDFRATAAHLVMSTIGDDGLSHLVVTDLEGEGARELPLPGEGYVTDLQSADRGNLVGYLFTDADIGADSGRESALFTASLAASRGDEPPTAVEREGGDARVVDWRFVPGSDSLLMMTFDGALTLTSAGGTPVALGNALGIDGIARGSATAIVERASGLVALDLGTAQEQELPATDGDLGQAWSVIGLPDGSGATVRVLSKLDDAGITVESTSMALVDAEVRRARCSRCRRMPRWCRPACRPAGATPR